MEASLARGGRYALYSLSGVTLGVALACSGTDDGQSASNFGGGGSGASAASSGTGASSASGGSGAIGIVDAGGGDTDLTPDSACVTESTEATLVKKPVDIVFVVDNSCSMSNENAAIENNINQNFASIIAASGIDYRVVLITSYSSGYEVQVGPPLGGGTGGNVPHNNPPIFYHYSTTIGSHNAWCRLFDTYETADPHGFGNGWKDWMRSDAFKVLVAVTDDGVSCSSTRTGNNYNDGNNLTAGVTSGDKFDQDLLALDPLQFGTAQDRNYVHHSILGIAASSDPSKAHAPTDPMTTAECNTGIDPGTGYQHVSMITGGLRFPVCEGAGFDAVFQKIAEGVIQGAQVACDIEIPPAPPGKEIDLATVKVQYTPSTGGADVILDQVPNAAACTSNAFYIEGNEMKLCPDSCTTVQGDDGAKLSVLFGCKTEGPR